MKEQEFQRAHGDFWVQMESWLETRTKARFGVNAKRAASETDTFAARDFPDRYRRLCHHLSLAKQRRYSPQLLQRLNDLVIACHHQFYRHGERHQFQWLRFVTVEFPAALRKESSYVVLGLALFFGPLFAMGISCYLYPDLIYSVMDAWTVRSFDAMYDPEASKLGRERDSASDLMMFGFYIKNNIGIAFQCFAAGMLLAVGSMFFIVYNGVVIGAVAGYLTQAGYSGTFWPFVAGHGSFELTAIAFSGAAGMMLGHALLSPGPFSRSTALRLAAYRALPIVYGAGMMLLIAAGIEAFWSSSAVIPPATKYGVGISLWVLVIAWCGLGGRSGGSTGTGSLTSKTVQEP